ncbi:MAG: hypothetical protein JXR05_06235 [Flavobacteriaceae bacterium]
MKSNFLSYLFHFLIFVFLTVITQIGGVVYLLSLITIKKKKKHFKFKRFGVFILLYTISTFLIIPNIAPFFGREKIKDNNQVQSHSFFTKLCNRNYVSPKLHAVLIDVSLRMNKVYPEVKLTYLDANFPFFDGFPLLPHLSHNDGKKIDLSFIYNNKDGNISNLKPSRSGYGIFEGAKKGEVNQAEICKENGYWQYDYSKYLTLGKTNKGIQFNEEATKDLVQFIIKNLDVQKVFIEPHLKTRLKLTNSKIRFHGCGAVRHDDHIHLQVN